MKRNVVKSMIALLLVCVMVGTLTACTITLKGTYTSNEGLVEQSFTFKDDNKVEVSAFGIDIEGEYLIEDGEITITYSLLGLSYDWVKSFEKKGSSIFIDGTEFVKEK
ncbi:MAG: hypothetical protein IKU07_08340 [Oscillospiraceae bacterium]|nr:hypothetical protein [Oscillospiraceae bacterium]